MASVAWPAAGSADVSPSPGTMRRAGKLPVSVGEAPTRSRADGQLPAKVKVSVAGRDAARAAGVDGVLLTAGRTDKGKRPGAVSVKVDYSSFRGAYGGDWAARLRLVRLPACALTTSDNPKCRTRTELPTTNDTAAGVLTAPVTLGAAKRGAAQPTVLAATAEASGPTGNYKATSLQPSGSWSAGGATGSFNWSYPITVPDVPGGTQPSISLDYSSQSVDGRTSASNNQPSWLGDGWSWEPGYIERRYKSCNDDKDKDGATNTTKVGDLCWYSDNATLSLGGKSTELVFEEGKGWHPESDSGEKVEKLTGADNKDEGTAGKDVGEHWRVTTADGTQYYFGLNHLPDDRGAKADDPVTNSTLTVPVFGNHKDEPCYKAAFADAWCRQAWRWQLDYVVDVRGNAMAYYWEKESNSYGRNVSETTGKGTVTDYDRGAYLDHIDYGLRDGAAYTGKAMGQVSFGTDERCLSACGTFDEANAKKWPDVPFDLYCKTGANECKDQFSPSFWSRIRLKSITTRILTGGAYADVDSWALDQTFPPSGDGISTPMWLQSITRTGKAGAAVSLPPVTFAGEQKANRVDKLGDGLAPFVRLRMSQITTEAGGTIAVDYSDPDCTAGSLPAEDDTNATRCYHLKWTFEGETAKDDWFNSYVTTQVTKGDNLAATPDTVTSYAYLGGAAWSKSTDEFTKPADRTYSVLRGYGRVQERKGAGFDAKTLAETRYFRGLDGKDVTDTAGAAVTDRKQFAGMVREQATYNGDDTAKLVTATSYTPWRSEPTATRARSGLPDLESRMTGTQQTSTRTTTSSGIRTTRSTTDFDQYGMTRSVSETGDTAQTGDEKCTFTTYARNAAKNILLPVARVETLARECTATFTRPDDVIDDTRTYYDNAAFGAAPTKMLVTKTDRINGKGDGYDVTTSVPSICGAAKNALCFDAYGRVLATSDAYGKVTATDFTPATGEAPTQTVVTNPLGHTTTTVLDPRRGQPTQVKDANSKTTTTAYDGLGRVKRVWLPTRPAETNADSPNLSFDYLVRTDGPIVTTTKSLTHDLQYQTAYAFADGLLRPFQTQEQSPDRSGRLITETFFDTRGLNWRSSGTYYADGAAEPLPVTGQGLKYPSSVDTQYDGAGRATAVIARKFGDETKRAVTTYTGDTTTVVRPTGGVATTTVTDALGQTTEVREYTNAARTTSQATKYVYDPRGFLKQVIDPSGAVWQYGYDVRGRRTTVSDPDKGGTTTTYDKGDRATDTKDARQITLHTDYDDLGRRTALKKGSTTLAAWEYDTVTNAKGQLAKTTRYIGGKAYESAVTAFNSLYQPLAMQVTIPDVTGETALAGIYRWTSAYNLQTGQMTLTQQPAMGGLPSERVSNTYTAVTGLLNTVGVPDASLVSANTYDHYGRNTRREYGAFGQHLWTSSEYDEHTGNVTRAYTDRDVAPQRVEDTQYGYDPAGNVTSVASAYGQDANRTTDTQCFVMDSLTRVTEAWTNTGEKCATAPSSTAVGGQDAYWTSFVYDAIGNRKSEIQHKTASGPTADTTRTYTAPDIGKHNLPKVTQAGTDPHTEVFSYDEAGNTRTRQIGTATAQTMLWDDEGHLASVTQGTAATGYLYDADGGRLLRRDSTGTTLYLPGGNELRLAKNGTVTGTRYYTVGDETIAVRTAGKISFLLNDHHGTNTTQITADATQAVTRRKSTLFGSPRGTANTPWVGDRAFVGGTKDTDTGLTHLGAREYDPAIGRFISVDPIMDLSSSQQLNGYTYANNNPVTLSDPSGLCPYADCPTRSTPDSENRTPTQAPSGPPRKSQNAQAAAAAGNVYPEQIHKKYAEVYPGVFVDKKWKYVNKFAHVLNQRIDAFCKYDTYGCGPETLDAQQMALLKFQACVAMQRGSGCFGKVISLGGAVAAAAVLTGGSGEGPLSGVEGPGRKVISCQCFLAGVDVLMANGKTKKIENIKVGDAVLATDPKTGRTVARRVTARIVTDNDKEFNELSIATEDGIEKLTATHEHPFWVPSKRTWVPAGRLSPGMTLLTDEGHTVIIGGNRHFTTRARTYNLTVDGLHTYYVLAGQTPVLVHNSSCPEVDEISENISKHALDSAKRPDGDGTHFVRGVDDGALPYYVDGMINGNVPNVETRYLRNGRVGYWDPDKRSVVIEDGEGGTVFTPKGGKDWFDNVLR
ncbi:polymorphic toxin-type HINT domain-containing protein [Streptomyces griseoluteus]|uniref:polymorphic toxin-type HINT domain-containing protein n=1 Tax=Streptomyces griseoluteus TaxID=29306 RepID=UPI00368CD136